MSDRLLDVIRIQLSDMEIFSALHVETRGECKKITYVHQGETMMVDPSSLSLVLERNLEWAFGRQGLIF